MAKFHFRYGEMNAEKSTILLQTAYNYEEKGKKIVLLKPSVDTKGDRKIVSRIGLERKVDYLIGENEYYLFPFLYISRRSTIFKKKTSR